jgi:NTE family protein
VLPVRPSFEPLGFLRPAAPWLVASAFLAPGPVRPGLLAGLLPRGTVDSAPMGDRIRLLMSDRWPDQPTWICATRLRDGKRVVFGRDDVDVPDLGTAVQASSAVPGYFAPVHIGDHDYLDGGLFSATNAELVARLGFDLVVVVSPMSATPDALDLSPGSIGRGLSARALAREVGRIRDEGTPVIVVQPTRDDLEVMGRDLMARAAAAPTARQARASVRGLLERDDVRDRLEILTAAASADADTR